MSMLLGEKAELTITSDYGYGPAGNPPTIPAGATLIFDVELLQVTDRRPTRNMMSDQELVACALRLKDDGNAKFKLQKYKQAEGHYRDALAHAEKCRVDSEEISKLKVTVLQNMSVCTNNTGDYKVSITNCSKAIALNAQAPKAHYLRSVANLKIANYDDALEDCKNAIKLNPSDKGLRSHFEAIKKEKAAKQAN